MRDATAAELQEWIGKIQEDARKGMLYYKNGILVSHTGKPITAQDVRNAQAIE